ncbi:MAG: EamA family transporter, partial [Propionibacteriaceae bacterium]
AVLCGTLTMFLQTWAQAHIAPGRAAVIMSMEPVWAAIFAVAVGQEHITWRMLVGGGAMFIAMILVVIFGQESVDHLD